MEQFNGSQQQEEELQRKLEQKNHSRVGVNMKKVMTDEQMETLRNQISVYSILSDHLVYMYKSFLHKLHLLPPGTSYGNLYVDPSVALGSQKIEIRQRWTPTPAQLQILEQIYERGQGTPGKQRVKDITTELQHHGQITETNVYNWFQNRRARAKRKESHQVPSNADRSQVLETKAECSNAKKIKTEINLFVENSSSANQEYIFSSILDHIGTPI